MQCGGRLENKYNDLFKTKNNCEHTFTDIYGFYFGKNVVRETGDQWG